MQNLSSGSNDNVSPAEAQEILAAWANRRQAQGVDPAANSVSALAGGLGVTEAEVRQMLEDIRVHKRSQEIAAGILDQQQQHRKRADINAAMIAAAVLVVLALLGGAAFLILRSAGHSGIAPVVVDSDRGSQIDIEGLPNDSGSGVHIKLPPLPPVTLSGNDRAVHVTPDGSVTTIEGDEFVHHDKNGSNINLSGQPAIDEVKRRIDLASKRISGLSQKKNLSADEKSQLENGRAELSTLQNGLKILEKNVKGGTPAAPQA